MLDQRLVDYVNEQLKRGYSLEQLSDYLIRYGYDAGQVNELVTYFSQQWPGQQSTSLPMPNQPYHYVQPVKESKKNLVFIIAGIALALSIGAGAFYYFFLSNDPGSLTKVEIPENIDCPKDKDCFNERFSGCKPGATGTIEWAESIEFFYEIIGPKEGYCEVKSMYLNNVNPEWAGKEMVCLYELSTDFENAFKDISRCEGELYPLIRGKF